MIIGLDGKSLNSKEKQKIVDISGKEITGKEAEKESNKEITKEITVEEFNELQKEYKHFKYYAYMNILENKNFFGLSELIGNTEKLKTIFKENNVLDIGVLEMEGSKEEDVIKISLRLRYEKLSKARMVIINFIGHNIMVFTLSDYWLTGENLDKEAQLLTNWNFVL